MTTLQTYYFEKQGTGDWHVHDSHGSGDMILEKGDVNTYVLPGMILWATDAAADMQTYSQTVRLTPVGFDPIFGTVVLYVQGGFIQRAELCGLTHSTVINHSLSRFSLTVPYFVGKRIPDECD